MLFSPFRTECRFYNYSIDSIHIGKPTHIGILKKNELLELDERKRWEAKNLSTRVIESWAVGGKMEEMQVLLLSYYLDDDRISSTEYLG